MAADPWPLAVLLRTISTRSKHQEPGWAHPPTLVWSPDQEEHLRAAWHWNAIWTTDVPDLHAGPITHARPAATLAVAQRGQQSPKWAVCMFSLTDAHIAICDPQRLPGPQAIIRVADCPRVIVKALGEGDHHAVLLQASLKGHAKAAKPGVWPAAALPADLELQVAVPTRVYHWLQAFHDLRGGASPTAKSAPRTGRTGYRQTRSTLASEVSEPRQPQGPSISPPLAAHGPGGQPHLRPSAGELHPQVGTASSGEGGHGAHKMPTPLPGARQRGGPGGGRGSGRGPPRGGTVDDRRGPGGGLCRPPGIQPPRAGHRPPPGPLWGRHPGPPGPGATLVPGCPGEPRGDAGQGQLTPGGCSGRRSLAPLMEPVQRPRPARPVPPGHTLTAPGAGGLYQQGAPHHLHAPPAEGLCHNAPRNRPGHKG